MAKQRSPVTAAKRGGPETTPIGVAVWGAVAAACASALSGYVPWGLMRTVDVPVLALGLASAVLLSQFFAAERASVAAREATVWRVGVALALVVAGIVVSTAFSQYRYSALFGMPHSAEGMIQLLACAGIVLGGGFSASSTRRAVGLVAPVVVFVETLFVATQRSIGQHPMGTLSNSTYMAQILLLALPLTLGGAFDERMRPVALRASWWRWALAASAFAAIAVSDAYNALAVVAAWLVWLAVIRWRAGVEANAGPSSGSQYVTFTASLIALGLLVYRLARPGALASLLGYRGLYWSAGWRMFAASPLLGVGPDVIRAAAAPTAPATMLERSGSSLGTGFGQLTVDPHNAVVWIAAYLGLAGLAAFGWLGLEMARNWRRQRSAGAGPNWLAMGAVLYSLTLLTAPAPPQTLVMFLLVAGASLRPERGAGRDGLARLATLSTAAVCGVAALLCIALGLTGLVVGSPGREVSARDAAVARTAATIWSLDPYLHYTASLRLAAVGGGTTVDRTDLGEIEKAVALAPKDPVYALEYARTLASYGADPARTRVAYERALALFPNSLEANLAYARYLVHVGESRRALSFALVGLRIAPEEPEANTVAADVYAALGQTARADAFRAKAARLNEARDAQP